MFTTIAIIGEADKRRIVAKGRSQLADADALIEAKRGRYLSLAQGEQAADLQDLRTFGRRRICKFCGVLGGRRMCKFLGPLMADF